MRKCGFLLLNCISSMLSVFPMVFRRFLYGLIQPWGGAWALAIRYAVSKSILAGRCGERVAVYNNVELRNAQNITLGNSVSLHPFCYIDGYGGVRLGNNVSVAHGSSIISFEHTWSDSTLPIKYNPSVGGEIIIEDDVWVGCGVRILSSSYIESRVVVAAGAVVRGRLESGWIYGGVPAKKLKRLL